MEKAKQLMEGTDESKGKYKKRKEKLLRKIWKKKSRAW